MSVLTQWVQAIPMNLTVDEKLAAMIFVARELIPTGRRVRTLHVNIEMDNGEYTHFKAVNTTDDWRQAPQYPLQGYLPRQLRASAPDKRRTR